MIDRGLARLASGAARAATTSSRPRARNRLPTGGSGTRRWSGVGESPPVAAADRERRGQVHHRPRRPRGRYGRLCRPSVAADLPRPRQRRRNPRRAAAQRAQARRPATRRAARRGCSARRGVDRRSFRLSPLCPESPVRIGQDASAGRRQALREAQSIVFPATPLRWPPDHKIVKPTAADGNGFDKRISYYCARRDRVVKATLPLPVSMIDSNG